MSDETKYMFENREVPPMTWWDLQEASCHGALVCEKVRDVERAGPVYKLRDPTTERYCFVFTDEAEQFSNPFATEDEAAKASRIYSDNL